METLRNGMDGSGAGSQLPLHLLSDVGRRLALVHFYGVAAEGLTLLESSVAVLALVRFHYFLR